MGRLFDRLFVWLCFTVGAALIPLFADAMNRKSAGQHVTLTALTERGQLLLVCIASGAAATGTLIASAAHQRAKLVAVGLAILALPLLAVYYGFAAAERHVSPEDVRTWSVVSFLSVLA